MNKFQLRATETGVDPRHGFRTCLEIHELIKAWVFMYDLSFNYSLVEETVEEHDAEGVLAAAVYDN